MKPRLLLLSLMLLAGQAGGFAQTVALGNIPDLPEPPQWPYQQFFRIRPIHDLGFSPDNRTLYFLRSDGEVDNVFAMDLESRRIRQLTHFREAVQRLVTGPVGRYLFLAADVGGNEQFNLYRYTLATGELRQLTHSPPADKSYICDLSADGKWLYFGQSHEGRAYSDLWRMDTRTGEREQVLASRGRLLECGPLSADGRYLAFYHFIENGERYLGVVDLQRRRQWYVWRQPHVNNVNAAFAGAALYFMNAAGADEFRLWRYDLRSGRLELAPPPAPGPLRSFTFYDDGALAVFQYRANLTTETALRQDRSRNSIHYRLPDERLIDAVFSAHDPGVAVFVTAAANQPERYYLFRAGDASPRLIYDANESGIAPDQFAQSRSLWMPSFDGLPIPLHLFIPNATSAQKPRPVVLWLHGGPEEYVDPEFDSDFQYFTNHGFIVAAPNVRGSGGFGKWFAHLDNGDWGGGHVRDAIATAAFLRRQPFVDGKHIFVLGESFGGYSVLSAITQFPNVFQGAIVFSGIVELASFVARLPDYAVRYLLTEMGFDPRQDPWRNHWLSPYYHLDRIRIPVQIHQGKNDMRVTEAETARLVDRLRRQGSEVEYYVYPNEGHGFLRFSNQQLAYQRVLRFVQRLSGKGSRIP